MKFTVENSSPLMLRSDLTPRTIFRYKEAPLMTPAIAIRLSGSIENLYDFNPDTGYVGRVNQYWKEQPVEILGTLKFEL